MKTKNAESCLRAQLRLQWRHSWRLSCRQAAKLMVWDSPGSMIPYYGPVPVE